MCKVRITNGGFSRTIDIRENDLRTGGEKILALLWQEKEKMDLERQVLIQAPSCDVINGLKKDLEREVIKLGFGIKLELDANLPS